MTIVVEDGSGVTGANSYIDEAYVTTFASERGFTAPSTTAIAENYILKAMDYLNHFRTSFIGSKSSVDNPLPWPRTDVILDGFDFSEEAIPEELKKAQAQLVIEQVKGTLLYPAPITKATEGLVVERTVGPLTKRFAANGNGVASPHKPIKIIDVFVFLESLLTGSATGYLYTRKV